MNPPARAFLDTFMNPLVKYLRDAREEIDKVTWPSQREIGKSTALVIALSLLLAAFLGVADYGLNKLLEYLLQIF